MKNKSAGKVKLASFDDLFGTSDNVSAEQITYVPLALLHPFRNHPYRVVDDEKMQETVKSVQERGVQIPGIVRPYSGGGYEVIAGHRRWRACELAGLSEMPVIIRDLDDNAATVVMVDTNIQREDILPSEKAKAYKMKYEAMKHQGSKADRHTADQVGEEAGDSARTVQRYIRLAELTEELLDFVDVGKIPMVAGEKLSYLQEDEQKWVVQAVGDSGIFPSKAQAEQLKAESEAGELTECGVYSILVKTTVSNVKVTISPKRIRDYFPVGYTKTEIEEVIYSLLDEWKQNKERGGEVGAGTSI